MWLGRRDLTRPAVAFGSVWFAWVALAQLQLTTLEEDWSTGFALMVLGGGALFVIAATLAGGTAPARGSVGLAAGEVRIRPLVVATVILIAGAVVGAAYKADRLGGVPLFSDNPDLVRGRAFTGVADLPTWSSALTGGFYLGMWCALAALWLGRGRLSRRAAAGIWLLALAGFGGVCLEASRNLAFFALAVPVIALYLVARPRPSRARTALAVAAAAVAVLGVGGLFALRLSQAGGEASEFIRTELDRQPAAVRPILPAYVNGALPLEGARRLYEGVPSQYSYGRGASSLTSLPNAAFPEGKAQYGSSVAALMGTGQRGQITWSVASYQGRLVADLGWRGVLLGSVLLGLAFGAVHRWARTRTGLLPVAAIAFVAYYAAFMVYDNQLSFTLIGFYDLAVIAAVGAVATGRIPWPARGRSAAAEPR